MTSTTDPTIEPPTETLQRHLDRQGRLSQWISLEGFNWLRDSQARQAANEEAENQWWRKTLGADSKQTAEAEDMGHTILGDITNPAPIIMQPPAPQQSSILPAAAMAVAAGLGGYLLADKSEPKPAPNQQPAIEFQDETVSVGLGRIEDYLKEQPNQ